MVCKTKKMKSSNGKKMMNPWIKHVMNEKKKYPKMKYSELLVKAKKSYSYMDAKTKKKK